MKTERFGGQPERSVFPVWDPTGFACSARKSRSPHAVFRKWIMYNKGPVDKGGEYVRSMVE